MVVPFEKCNEIKIYEVMKRVLLSSYEEVSSSVDDEQINLIFSQEKEYIRLNIDFVKLASSIIKKNLEQFKLSMNRIQNNLTQLSISEQLKLNISIIFFDTFERYVKQEKCGNVEFYVKKLKDMALKFFSEPNKAETHEEPPIETCPVEENADLDFIEFEDFEADNFNNELHSFKKISAVEWLEEYKIEQEEIEDINESIDEFYTLAEVEENLSERYLETSLNTLNTFAKFFNETIEFMEFSDIIKDMMTLINSVYYSIGNDKKPILKMLIDSIINDLKKWTEEVLNKKIAIDIHYLDASIYSSIAQIELVLGEKNNKKKIDLPNETDESDELELF